MNTSPKFEAEIGEMARRQSREEYRDTTLPPNHMLSRHVRRVVSRILAASNLGVVQGGDVSFSYNEQSGTAGGDGWDPDAKLGVGAGRAPGEEREWDVMVVNDPKMVNAQVVPGDGICLMCALAAHTKPQGSLSSTLESYPYVKMNRV
jgi:hypothetical protein